MELTQKQEMGLKIAVERYKHNEPYTCIAGYAGSGKAQPLTTMIPTPTGYKKLGELKVGDYVFDRNGKPTKIIGYYPQGKIPCYKITFEDGRISYCNDNHIWTVYTSKGNFIDKTVKMMLSSGLKNNGSKGTYKFKVPTLANPVEFIQDKELPIDPYVIGAFLGDGCCKEKQLTISSENSEIPDMIAKLINAKDNKACKKTGNNYNWTFMLPKEQNDKFKFQTLEFFNLYKDEICVSAEFKKIPDDYKYSSVENRFALLQGLMDTDGSITNDGKRFGVRFTSTSMQLIKDMQEILYSLGYKGGTISVDTRNDKYTTGECYNININIPNEEKYKLFRLRRKVDIAEKAKEIHKHKKYDRIAIYDIQQVEDTEMACIMVDNPEHLYLTEDYIVTHNTTLVNYIIDALELDREDVCYAAFTGKAAQVLKEKGAPNAITTHKLLYMSKRRPDGTYQHFPRKTLKKAYRLIVIDEISMLPQHMWDLLLSFKVPVIALGDPGQLPAITQGTKVLNRPHIFLDEIMRQAQESEIIRLTMDIRAGRPIPVQSGKEVQVISKNNFDDKLYNRADIVIAATNKTRRDINHIIRANIFGEEIPDENLLNNDKVICLNNNWKLINEEEDCLVNGLIGTTNYVRRVKSKFYKYFYRFNFLPENMDESHMFMDVNTDAKIFLDGSITKLNPFEYKKAIKLEQFDYGYCITAHKSQGSEWDKVLVIEENFPYDRIEHIRWLYTAATRSKEKLIIVQK